MFSADFFSKSTFSKNYFRNTIRVSNNLDPDQVQHFVWPDLGPNCLQRLSAGRQRVNLTLTLPVTGPRSAVGNVAGYRCVSDCRSRGREFDPGPVPYFRGNDHEIISTVILLPSADSFKKGCCQLQAKVCAQITG